MYGPYGGLVGLQARIYALPMNLQDDLYIARESSKANPPSHSASRACERTVQVAQVARRRNEELGRLDTHETASTKRVNGWIECHQHSTLGRMSGQNTGGQG